jgi:hypothetical protein
MEDVILPGTKTPLQVCEIVPAQRLDLTASRLFQQCPTNASTDPQSASDTSIRSGARGRAAAETKFPNPAGHLRQSIKPSQNITNTIRHCSFVFAIAGNRETSSGRWHSSESQHVPLTCSRSCYSNSERVGFIATSRQIYATHIFAEEAADELVFVNHDESGKSFITRKYTRTHNPHTNDGKIDSKIE